MNSKDIEVVTIALYQMMQDVIDALDTVADPEQESPERSLQKSADRFIRTGVFIGEYLDNIKSRDSHNPTD